MTNIEPLCTCHMLVDGRHKSSCPALYPIDPRWIKQAEEDLPCTCTFDGRAPLGGHFVDCPERFRFIYAQRLQEAFEAGLNKAVEIPMGGY